MLLERASRVFKEQRIESYTTDVLLTRVSMLLRQTYVLVGFQTPDENDLAIITAKLTSDLFESYRYLTCGEVSLCFELGAKGEYGEFMGLNMRTFTRWLKAYKTSDFRYRLVVDREQKRQAALPPVSEAYNREREEQMLQNAFRHYRAGYPIDQLLPARVYRIPRPGTDRRQPGGQAVGNEAVRTLEAVRHAADGRGNAPAFCENEGDDGIAQTLLR